MIQEFITEYEQLANDYIEYKKGYETLKLWFILALLANNNKLDFIQCNDIVKNQLDSGIIDISIGDDFHLMKICYGGDLKCIRKLTDEELNELKGS